MPPANTNGENPCTHHSEIVPPFRRSIARTASAVLIVRAEAVSTTCGANETPDRESQAANA